MTHAAAGRDAALLDLLPFDRHDLSIDAMRLQVLELGLQLTFLVLAAEEVHAIEDRVRETCHLGAGLV